MLYIQDLMRPKRQSTVANPRGPVSASDFFFRAHEPMKRCLKSAMFTLKMKILIAFKQIQQISQLINN